jgi:hypothetical protein
MVSYAFQTARIVGRFLICRLRIAVLKSESKLSHSKAANNARGTCPGGIGMFIPENRAGPSLPFFRGSV